jgi:hypothetical protein
LEGFDEQKVTLFLSSGRYRSHGETTKNLSNLYRMSNDLFLYMTGSNYFGKNSVAYIIQMPVII